MVSWWVWVLVGLAPSLALIGIVLLAEVRWQWRQWRRRRRQPAQIVELLGRKRVGP